MVWDFYLGYLGNADYITSRHKGEVYRLSLHCREHPRKKLSIHDINATKTPPRVNYCISGRSRQTRSLAAALIASAETTADLASSLFTTTHGHVRLRLSRLYTYWLVFKLWIFRDEILKRTGCCVTMSPLSAVMAACWVGSIAAGILNS